MRAVGERLRVGTRRIPYDRQRALDKAGRYRIRRTVQCKCAGTAYLTSQVHQIAILVTTVADAVRRLVKASKEVLAAVIFIVCCTPINDELRIDRIRDIK